MKIAVAIRDALKGTEAGSPAHKAVGHARDAAGRGAVVAKHGWVSMRWQTTWYAPGTYSASAAEQAHRAGAGGWELALDALDAALDIRCPDETRSRHAAGEGIEQAQRDDPEAAGAEWLAEFRGDLADFIDRRVLEACVEPGVHERPYRREYRYVAFCDPSSGQRDSMCLGIAHREGARAVLDCLREMRARDVRDKARISGVYAKGPCVRALAA